ncbi:chloride channel protein [Sphingomonas ginkgonis]|uniref:Chloride channel protein n=1 Tax=Sphingomonas ginkgonis TaxID=2315330 RepID=A0A3R9YNU3_9SPHN|nr:chloride channel protein [Sphingomonas ginkgonis]RST31744.1 chloride channel protein [Sphingomonas ginkgonis]
MARPGALIRWIRRRARTSEYVFIALATAVGAAAAVATILIGAAARTLQHWFYRLPPTARLSELPAIGGPVLLVLPLGGAALILFNRLTRARRRPMVDAVEANALHGGIMSVPDSLVISGQTAISNGFGASVGLEAAYAQLGGAAASVASRLFNPRRADRRVLVGAGAGAAIAAAFGAPLAGAFYAFEIVIGAYTPSAIAPVAAASLAGALVAQGLGVQPYLLNATAGQPVETHHYLLYGLLGAICALLGILLMLGVAGAERLVRLARVPDAARPVLGGALLMPIALVSPQVLSAGHGALHADLAVGVTAGFILTILLAKSAASIISLACSFRGGLFFASLFLGTLIGQLFALGLAAIVGHPVVSPVNAALVGMAGLAVAVVGGPMTMAMLVLEATHDFGLTGAVIAAALIAGTIVRETFGYSFSTWRLHLRGESVRSARDVGWVRSLTARQMMRRDTKVMLASSSIGEFRRRFPLGSTTRVVLIEPDGTYAGIVPTAVAYGERCDPAAPVQSLAVAQDKALSADLDIATVMRRFDAAQSDELAVLDSGRKVLGLISETFVRRRYAEELEKSQRELFGEA